MAREILFRGKRTDNGEWVTGVPYFIPIEDVAFIINNCQSLSFTSSDTSFQGYPVEPVTIGQLHNGLSKKAGVNIFVGDIIRHDLEAGLGQPKRIGLTETVRSVEFDFQYYSNVRLIGNIHEEREVKNG